MSSGSGSHSSRFNRTVSFSQWKTASNSQRSPLFSLSSSFHPCSAYMLPSNLVFLHHQRRRAIIGSLHYVYMQRECQTFQNCLSVSSLYTFNAGAPQDFHSICLYLGIRCWIHSNTVLSQWAGVAEKSITIWKMNEPFFSPALLWPTQLKNQ